MKCYYITEHYSTDKGDMVYEVFTSREEAMERAEVLDKTDADASRVVVRGAYDDEVAPTEDGVLQPTGKFFLYPRVD